MTTAFRFGDLLAQVGEEETNKALPPDTYTVVVEEAEAVIAQSSGNPMLKVKFSVVGGPYNGKWLWNNFVLAINSDKGPDALKPFFRQMRAFDLDADFFNSLGDQGLEAVAPLLVGKTVDVKTDVRHYNNQEYTDVRGVSKSYSAPLAVPPVGSTPQVPSPATPIPGQAVPPVPAPGPAVPTPPPAEATVPTPGPAAEPPKPPF